MYDMMGENGGWMWGGSMWGGGLVWILILILLVLAIAALVKYLKN
ncbi:hypothetical protein [Amorphus sp. 3PC139-8]